MFATKMDNYSIYLHIPFCTQRCGYCDFNSTAGRLSEIPAYVDALCLEINSLAARAPEPVPVHTIFFGGGTPSLLPVQSIDKIMDTLSKFYDLQPNCEISLEANPKTVSYPYFCELRGAGFNRLSLGMQSAHPEDLQVLQRLHTQQDVNNSVDWARQAGFDNINLDLIYGIPLQSLERWKDSLTKAVELHPQHLSLYALTLEPGTPLYYRLAANQLPPMDEDLAADMYELSENILEEHNYAHYEISNWALKKTATNEDFSCKHNLQYWRNQPYLGFGAGAHGYACGHRMANEPELKKYIELCSADKMENAFPFSPANCGTTPIDKFSEMQETMMVGLRLTLEGISNSAFYKRFQISLTDAFGEKILLLVKKGLLEWKEENQEILRLTRHGRLLGNQVFMQFVGKD